MYRPSVRNTSHKVSRDSEVLKTSLAAELSGYVKVNTVLKVIYTMYVSDYPELLIPGGEEDFSSHCIGRVLEIPPRRSAEIVRL